MPCTISHGKLSTPPFCGPQEGTGKGHGFNTVFYVVFRPVIHLPFHLVAPENDLSPASNSPSLLHYQSQPTDYQTRISKGDSRRRGRLPRVYVCICVYGLKTP
ncbi:hypothetical protein BaRGS_00021862 [Batillaria attramentaria]|uniref:Uncharacterized protein n=1 Tax=Batillaria attramentaria TaxID=370345 RepID=A0ABD0KIU1_9CAEN